MTQPTFSPVPKSGEVRPTVTTASPEFSRAKKAGLLGGPSQIRGLGHGTPAPGEGFALTIAEREVAKLNFEHEHDRHDVAIGVGLVAAKRASLIGRGPQLRDVQAAFTVLGLPTSDVLTHDLTKKFAGLAHSYFLQRSFVDGIDAEELRNA